jgi:LacI family transcriptional regulator
MLVLCRVMCDSIAVMTGAPDDSDTAATSRSTVTDVARQAGVSSMTVSRVLNGQPGASDETRKRVLEAAEQLGYRPNALARSLKQRSSRTVGMLVPDIANPFFPEIIRGAEDFAQANGYALLLCNVQEDVAREAALLQMLEGKRVDGVIVCSARSSDDDLARLIGRHEAVVLINRTLGSDRAGTIQIDYAAGAAKAVAHLVDTCGRQRIAILAGPRAARGGIARVEGAMAALAARGLAPAAILHGTPDLDGGRAGADQLPSGIDGLICYNDLVAAGVLQRLAALVPHTLAIIGFDDIPLAGLLAPPLTSLRVDKAEIGRTAMRMLLDRRGGMAKQQTVLVEPTLIVRGTTG